MMIRKMIIGIFTQSEAIKISHIIFKQSSQVADFNFITLSYELQEDSKFDANWSQDAFDSIFPK